MTAGTIANEGNIPIRPTARKTEREVVGLAQIRLTLGQFFLAFAVVGAILIGIGINIGKMNALNDEVYRFEKYTDTRFDKVDARFDKIDATLESIQKELHQNSLDVAQLKQQMVDSKGKR